MNTRGARISHLPITTFCWLPPERCLASVASTASVESRTRRAVSPARSLAIAAVHEAEAPGQLVQRGQHHVAGDAGLHQQTLLAAVLGEERQAGIDRLRRAVA